MRSSKSFQITLITALAETVGVGSKIHRYFLLWLRSGPRELGHSRRQVGSKKGRLALKRRGGGMFTLKPAVLAIVMCLVFLFSPLTVWGGQREITLKLGGQYCGAYLGDVKNALKKHELSRH